MRPSILVTLIAVCALCGHALCDPMDYMETFTGSNANWRTDEDTNANLFASTTLVTYDSDSQSVYAPYPGLYGTPPNQRTKTTLIFADYQSSGGNLAGSEDYSSIPSLSVWLKLSTTDVLPGVAFFMASNKNTGSDTLTAGNSTEIWYAFVSADPNYLGTSWYHYTHDLSAENWSQLRGSGSEDFSAILADVDAIGVIMSDTGYTQYNLYVDNFTATPEPASLLMMGPMAGFLGLKVLRRKRTSVRKVV